jgi:hypothetical protein
MSCQTHAFGDFFVPHDEDSTVAHRMSFMDDRCSHVRVAHQAISKCECASLIKAADDKLEFTAPLNFDPRDRIAERAHIVDPSLSVAMMARLRPFFPEIVIVDGARWRLTRFTHHWRFVRYHKGGHFAPHYDGAKLLPWYEMSMFTVQLYLNSKGEDFWGGDTRFYMDHEPDRQGSHDIVDGQARRAHDVQIFNNYTPTKPMNVTHAVVPRAGDVLIFNHAAHSKFHDTDPLLDGFKYILRGDLMYAAVPEDLGILQQPTLPEQLRTWCPETGKSFGTRDFVGQVWRCQCANDKHGSACKHAGNWQDYRTDPLTSTNFADKDRAGRNGIHKVAVVISGKKACGKNFVASALLVALKSKGLQAAKCSWAAVGSSAKHTVKAETSMNEQEDLDAAMQTEQDTANILLFTDISSGRQIAWLKNQFGDTGRVVFLRIDTSDQVRDKRGWTPTLANNTPVSETELDSFRGWDACFDNSGDSAHGMVEEWVANTVVPRVFSCISSAVECSAQL